jgi:hypothetical protein
LGVCIEGEVANAANYVMIREEIVGNYLLVFLHSFTYMNR